MSSSANQSLEEELARIDLEATLRLYDPFSEQLIRASFSRYDEESAAMVDGEKETGGDMLDGGTLDG